MNREEIKKIGLEAGISEFAFGLASEEAWQQVERFVALVISVEREACARVCDQRAKDYGYETDFYAHEHVAEALQCAALIRARGQE